jgi:hypothetical protein
MNTSLVNRMMKWHIKKCELILKMEKNKWKRNKKETPYNIAFVKYK